MYKSASEQISDLKVRLASLRHRIASDDMITLSDRRDLFYASEDILWKIEKGASSVTLDATGTSYASLTGAKLKKALIDAMVANVAKVIKAYEAQNARLEKEIAELRGKGKRMSRERAFEIRVREGMFIEEKGFQKVKDKITDIKKIKVSKKGNFFIVSK